MIQGAIILAIVAAIFGTGFASGKKWSDSNWKTVYYTLAEQMATMQSELNLKAEKAKGEANTLGAEITVIGKVSEAENDYIKKEVDARVDKYLDHLLIGELLFVTEGKDSNESGYPSSLSRSARTSFERGGTGGLFANLDEFERAALKEIIRKAEHQQTEAIKRQIYLKEQEDKMKPLRNKFNQ